MLTVLCAFIYCGITMFLLGIGFRHLIIAKNGYEISGLDNIIFSGLIISTIYAQSFSLFHKVGIIANILMIAVCILVGIFCHKEIIEVISSARRSRMIFNVILLLICAYFTSRGYFHYDTDLYHAQSIRWIEEFGVINGLGNLHNRLAYNSSLFALTALYSLRDIFGQSLHITNGFIAFIVLSNIWSIFEMMKEKRINVSFFLQLGVIYYFVDICDDINSPASDYAVLLTAFFIIIKWTQLLEKEEKDITPYALLCVAGVFAITLKLSACVMLLLVIKPVIYFLRNKEYKKIFIYLLLGIITVLPWIIRNIILSGYLVYPFPAIDLFDVDWKIPLDVAIHDAEEIKAWGKANFEVLTGMEKLLVAGDFISLIILGVFFIRSLLKKSVNWDKVLLVITIISCFLFWLYNSPLLRYGYSYVLILLFFTVGLVYEILLEKNKRLFYLAGIAVSIFFIGWKSVSLGKNVIKYAKWPNYIKQQDYNNAFEAATYEVDGVTIYYPINGDRIGYEKFPASVFVQDISLRKDSLKGGFKSTSRGLNSNNNGEY